VDEVDLIVSGGSVVTMDAERRIVTDGFVAVLDGAIVAVGKREELAGRYRASKTIDAAGCVVTPGLIDAHNHPVHYFSRGMCDDIDLRTRLIERVFPYESKITDEEAHLAASAGFVEMIQHGTTCFCDGASYNPHAVARAATEVGIRGIVARGTLDTPDPILPSEPEPTEIALGRADEVVDTWSGNGNGRVRAWYDLGRPEGVSDELCRAVKEHADARGVGIVGHIVLRRPPRSPRPEGESILERYDRLGVLAKKVLFAHLGWVDEQEVELIAASGVGIAHCPSASLLGGSGWVAHGSIPDLVDAGAVVVLGTDAAAISRFLDLVRVMYVGATAHKDARRDALTMGAYKALEMTTVDAARALAWESEIGSLEPRKRADLAVFSTDAMEWYPNPLENPVADLVYCATGDSARTVVIDGHVVMEDRVLKTVDVAALCEEMNGPAREVLRRVGVEVRPRWPVV
jgi:5-methylthioadenosine/S-adenosylhomocysteine deaminase